MIRTSALTAVGEMRFVVTLNSIYRLELARALFARGRLPITSGRRP